MDKIERFLWLVCHAALTALVVIVCVKLCTGCKSVESDAARANISAFVKIGEKTAALDNRVAFVILYAPLTSMRDFVCC